jgi:hypothetical protein
VLDLRQDQYLAIHAMRLRPKFYELLPGEGASMTDAETYRTAGGRELTDDEIDRLADEAATTDYDIDTIKARRRGRPLLGSAPAEVVPVRLDPDLRAAVETRAEADDTTSSEVIRRALRAYLHVA